jgi:hypothetical protein
VVTGLLKHFLRDERVLSRERESRISGLLPAYVIQSYVHWCLSSNEELCNKAFEQWSLVLNLAFAVCILILDVSYTSKNIMFVFDLPWICPSLYPHVTTRGGLIQGKKNSVKFPKSKN